MKTFSYQIDFTGLSSPEANLAAKELQNALLDASQDISAEVIKPNPDSQDFGSTLVLVLGAPAVVVAAKAIGNWLMLRNSAAIDITDGNKRVIAKNLTSKDAASLVSKLTEAL